MTKVMRKEARHTQRRDRASGVPLEILEHLPPKPESACSVKNPPAMRKSGVPSLHQEDLLVEGMAMRSSILAWRSPMHEEAGGLQSMHLEGWPTWAKVRQYHHSSEVPVSVTHPGSAPALLSDKAQWVTSDLQVPKSSGYPTWPPCSISPNGSSLPLE